MLFCFYLFSRFIYNLVNVKYDGSSARGDVVNKEHEVNNQESEKINTETTTIIIIHRYLLIEEQWCTKRSNINLWRTK